MGSGKVLRHPIHQGSAVRLRKESGKESKFRRIFGTAGGLEGNSPPKLNEFDPTQGCSDCLTLWCRDRHAGVAEAVWRDEPALTFRRVSDLAAHLGCDCDSSFRSVPDGSSCIAVVPGSEINTNAWECPSTYPAGLFVFYGASRHGGRRDC